MRAFLATAVWFGGAVLLVMGMMVVLFWTGFFGSVSILLYRGLLILAVCEAACFAALMLLRRRWRGWQLRDAVSACAFAAGVAVSVLTLLPVTIDRSMSVFLLARMAAEPDRSFSMGELETIFVRTYVQGFDQVQRRMDEQRISGNVIETPEGYRIGAQGAAFVRFGRLVSKIFRTDPRFVDPGRDVHPPVAVTRPP